MSDQEDKVKQGMDGEAAPEQAAEQAAESTVEAAPEPAPKQAAAPAPRKSSSAIAWISLLLTLALAGGVAWLLPQLQAEKDALQSRIDRLESSTGQEDQALAAMERSLKGELESGLSGLSGQLQSETARFSQSLLDMESQMAEQRAELAGLRANDRSSWLLAEAEYLLRLANQRLIMAGDTVAARALLNSADNVLRELDDISMHKVRAALAADLAAVRAVPTIDTQGIYLRLSALIEQADNLAIFQLPELEASATPVPADDLQGRFTQSVDAALKKLSDYIIIRRRDVPMQALMDPQWESMVRQNMRMLLEQAQVALLSGNESLYRESVERTLHWVDQFRDSDEVAAAAMVQELKDLATMQIASDMPDISRSLRELDKAVEQRLDQQAAGE